MKNNDKKTTTWISPEIRCSYPNLFEPANEEFGGKFGLGIPLPKSDQAAVDALWEAVRNAAENTWGPKARELKGIKTFVTDCDDDSKYEGDDVYSGCVKFSAKAKRRPGLVYPNMATVEVDDIETVFYPGCYIRVSVRAYGTEVGGTRTVAFGLSNVMFVKDGERIGGGADPEEDFAEHRDDSYDRFGTAEMHDDLF